MQIKGINNGILVKFRATDWEKQKADMIQEITSQAKFFQGANISLDLGSLGIKAAELGKVRDELSELGLTLVSVISDAEVTRQSARLLGVEDKSAYPDIKPLEATGRNNSLGAPSILIKEDIVSGKIIKAKETLVIVGNVEVGAQVISESNVIIWGAGLGALQAGNSGNTSAFICALRMTPTYLQIADVISTPTRRRSYNHAEMAYIANGAISRKEWKV